MKFGLKCFGLSARHYPEIARVAEQHGFESLWVPEHLVFPAELPPLYSYNAETGLPPMDSHAPAYDPWVIIGAMAAVTSTIKLGTGVFILPLRHPVAVARSLVTLDRLSGGRVIAGVGAGWLVDEFEVVGIPPEGRGRRMDECMEVMRKLWGPDEVIEHHGEFFSFPPITFEPKPISRQPIPLLVGGLSAPALRRAGRLGDGFISHRPVRSHTPTAEDIQADLASLTREFATVQRHREEAGRADLPFELQAGLGATLDEVQALADLGVTRYTIGPLKNPLPKEEFAEWIQRFGEDIISKCP